PETKVIEKARSIGKVKPDKNKYVVYASLIGFLIASLLVFWREAFTRKVANMSELIELTKMPVLGQVFKSKEMAEQNLTDLDPKSGISESFRSLRTNLQYFSPSNLSKTI